MFPLGVILNQMRHRMDAPMYRAAVLAAAVAEIRPGRGLAEPGHMDAVLDQLINALVFRCGDWHHRHPSAASRALI